MQYLVAHLRGLDQAALARLIAARPDAVAWPEPRTLTELAERLSAAHSVQRALGQVSRAGLQVAEAMAALRGAATEAELTGLLDTDDDRSELLVATLFGLTELALVVRDGEGVLWLAGPLRQLAEPLRLGSRLADLLPTFTVERLRMLAERVAPGPVARRKSDLIAQIMTALRDGDSVRGLLAQAPQDVEAMLLDTAWNGPRVTGVDLTLSYRGGPVAWAVERGLLALVTWDDVSMPAEVALALRGPDYRAPFTPPPPEPVSGAVDEAGLAVAGAAMATQTLADAGRLLDLCDRTPLATTKAGKVAVRELKRAGKALGLDQRTLATLLSATTAAGLLGVDDGALVLTERADAWRAAEPAPRLAALLRGWWAAAEEPVDLLVRHRVVEYLANLPAGTCVDDVGALAASLAWRRPVSLGSTSEDQARTVARTSAAWAEAERFGVVALGAATRLARALVATLSDGDDGLAGLITASAGLVPVPVSYATFQSDLTVVVAGVPTAGLGALLDGVAAREAAGAASTWRFSAETIRAALDTGADPDGLLTELTEVATGELPQALRYLVRDVARRHGLVQVAPAACVLCADDPTLLAEIAATKALRPLRLRVVAPTVLVSALCLEKTLAALRDAGYAPTGQTEAGATMVECRSRRRASIDHDDWIAADRRPVQAVDADAVAERLLAAPAEAAGVLPLFEADRVLPERVVALRADGLSTTERRVLVDAIETGAPIRIDYTSATGQTTTRVIENAELSGDAVIAWCRLRDAERMFVLSRIRAVAAAT